VVVNSLTVCQEDWVARRLGIRLTHTCGDPRPRVRLALRHNPRRVHLLVSAVLGKYIPVPPGQATDAGRALGHRVDRYLEGHQVSAVLGYAETATGLGHLVSDVLAGTYLHSTRRAVPGIRPLAEFQEPHSHAPSHLLLPARPEMFAADGPLVLVDDELTTGSTMVNTIVALHARYPRQHYVIATLIDARPEEQRKIMVSKLSALGAQLHVVALMNGVVQLPPDALSRGFGLVAAEDHLVRTPQPVRHGEVHRVPVEWPAGLPDGGRHGFTAGHRALLATALPDLAERLATVVRGPRVLLLGFEEFMYVPLRLAELLENRLTEQARDAEVRFASTARSRMLAVDVPDYPIRTRLSFPAPDLAAGSGERRYAYNVAPGLATGRRFDSVICVVDDAADSPALHAEGGLLDLLGGICVQVMLVVIPTYRPDDVSAPTQQMGRS
jgi:hypothetical protein